MSNNLKTPKIKQITPSATPLKKAKAKLETVIKPEPLKKRGPPI